MIIANLFCEQITILAINLLSLWSVKADHDNDFLT